MATKKIALSLVSYLNTLPFLEGFKRTPDHAFEVKNRTPADCAADFIQGKSELALMPVGSLLQLENYSIVTDFCIGCNDYVRTVKLYSHYPLEEAEVLYLDVDSRTSVLLSQIILREKMKRKIYVHNGIPEKFHQGKEKGAVLAIGDKVFELENHFTYSLDLGHAWKEFTGLPFVFAVFVSNSSVDEHTVSQLNEILKLGIDHIPDLDLTPYTHIPDIKSYYTDNISYFMDKNKWQAMKMFMEAGRYYLR